MIGWVDASSGASGDMLLGALVGVGVPLGVIADAVAAAVARRTGAERGRVSVTMGRRTVTVRIVPTSGVAVDPAAAESAVHDTLAEVGFSSATRVVVSTEGVVA